MDAVGNGFTVIVADCPVIVRVQSVLGLLLTLVRLYTNEFTVPAGAAMVTVVAVPVVLMV